MGTITDLLKELPLSAVLREKILALEAALEDCKRENAILIDKIQKINKENRILKKKKKDADEEPPDWGDVEPV